MIHKSLSLKDFKKQYKLPSTKKEYFNEYFSKLSQSELQANPELVGAIKYDKPLYYKNLGQEERLKVDPDKMTDENRLKIIDKLNSFSDHYEEYNQEKKENDKEIEVLKKDLNQFITPFKKIMNKDIIMKRDDIQFGKIKDEYNKRNIKVPKLDQFKSNVFKPSLLIIEKSEINNYFFFGINTNADADNDQINYLTRLGRILNDKKMGKEEIADEDNENDVVKELKKAERRRNNEIERKRLKRHYDKWENANMKDINNVSQFVGNVTKFVKFYEKENHEFYKKHESIPKTAKEFKGNVKAIQQEFSPLKKGSPEKLHKNGSNVILPPIKGGGAVFSESFHKSSGKDVFNFDNDFHLPVTKHDKKCPKRQSFSLKSYDSSLPLQVLYQNAVNNKGRGDIKEIEKYFACQKKPMRNMSMDPQKCISYLYADKQLMFKKNFVQEEGDLIRKNNGNVEMTDIEKKYFTIDHKIEKDIHKCEAKLINLACENKNCRKGTNVSEAD